MLKIPKLQSITQFAQLFETHFQPTIPIDFPHNQLINNIPHQQLKTPYERLFPKTFSKPFKTLHKNHNSQFSDFQKLWFFKSVSQNLDTSNAKTHNTKLIGHKTSFPKQQAPSIDSQTRESYARNTQTAEQETDSHLSFKTPFLNPSYSHTFHTTKSSTTCHNNNHNTTTSTTSHHHQNRPP